MPNPTEASGGDGDAKRVQAVAALAGSLRRLCEAAVSTAASRESLDRIRAELDATSEELEEAPHPGVYSGLLGTKLDFRDPHAILPLSPVIGRCNPISADIDLRYENGQVRGRARLGKRHVGPPNCAHGGVGAAIADQLVALGPPSLGKVGYPTAELHLYYRRPTPLYEELELEAHCEAGPDGIDESVVSYATIRAGGKVTLEAEATLRHARKGIGRPARDAEGRPIEKG